MRISQIRDGETVSEALDRVIDTARNENLEPLGVRLWPEDVDDLGEEVSVQARAGAETRLRKYRGVDVVRDAHVPEGAMRLAFGSTDECQRWSYLEREGRDEA